METPVDILNELEKIIDTKLSPMLELQQQLINQNIHLTALLEKRTSNTSNTPKGVKTSNYSSSEKNKTSYSKSIFAIIDHNSDGVLVISGNNYDVKEIIKDEPLNGVWTKDKKCWTLSENATVADIKDKLEGKCELTFKCASW